MQTRSYMSHMTRPSTRTLLFITLACSCANDGESAELTQLGDLVREGQKLEASAQSTTIDDARYRRTYGAADVKMHECATMRDTSTIVGENCPSSFVVFGPYVFAPGNADVSLRFELKASSELKIASDIVSAAAQNMHAATPEQRLTAGETTQVAYKVRFFEPAEGLEARLWIGSDAPAWFELRQLAIEIQ